MEYFLTLFAATSPLGAFIVVMGDIIGEQVSKKYGMPVGVITSLYLYIHFLVVLYCDFCSLDNPEMDELLCKRHTWYKRCDKNLLKIWAPIYGIVYTIKRMFLERDITAEISKAACRQLEGKKAIMRTSPVSADKIQGIEEWLLNNEESAHHKVVSESIGLVYESAEMAQADGLMTENCLGRVLVNLDHIIQMTKDIDKIAEEERTKAMESAASNAGEVFDIVENTLKKIRDDIENRSAVFVKQ